MKDYTVRINLKTDAEDRAALIDFCLANPLKQYLAIGWSSVHEDGKNYSTYEEYYSAVEKRCRETNGRVNPVLNIFWYVEANDLFWTRDLDGYYWVCRAKGKAMPHYDKVMDIGAVVEVEAYKYSTQVPGQIKAAFNRANAGVAQRIYETTEKNVIYEFTKLKFNELSGRTDYAVENMDTADFLGNLPDFELEELVIAYIQIKQGFYVLSNSIANKSTTVAIECEFMSRHDDGRKAVVQVKGPKHNGVDAASYQKFLDDGYEVFLYAPEVENTQNNPNVHVITREDLLDFYKVYRSRLPESITCWERLFSNKMSLQA